MADRADDEGIEETEAVKAMKAGLQLMIDGGATPRQRGAEKAAEALDWIFRWGWSSRSIVATLRGTGRGGALGSRLVRNGWVKSEAIRIASSHRLTPTDILKITPLGMAELEALRGELPSSDGGPIKGRVHKQNIIHDLMCQRLSLMYMGKWPGFWDEEHLVPYHGPVVDFLTAQQMGGDSRQVKRPDAIWTMRDGTRLAIEVEMSPKFGRELDNFICGHIRLQQGGDRKVDGLVVFCTNRKTALRYQAAMMRRRVVTDWQWDHKKNEWYDTPNTKLTVPDNFEVQFLLLPSDRPKSGE